MRKVFVYSLLLVLGLVGSQFLGHAPHGVGTAITLATMASLSFIMIHVGYEFELDKSRLRDYGWDAVVSFLAASLPWVLCTLYFVFVMAPRDRWASGATWQAALLEGMFAAPTSAGILFSMLAAAGLGATWVFGKARVLAILDDLSTILLLVPLKILLLGPRWQLLVIVLVMLVLLWVAWRYMHRVRLPIRWPFVAAYALTITAASEAVSLASTAIDPQVPVHLEVLLPAFALGCVLARPAGADPHCDDSLEGAEEGPEDESEQRVSTVVSAAFMVLVGLSMPPVLGGGAAASSSSSSSSIAWGTIALHVVAVTVLSNLGKMFPALCYRREASLSDRLALSVGMFPRGEVGAGVLVVAMSYGLAGPTLTVAVLSLALNLLLTGIFILIVKKLVTSDPRPGDIAPR